MTRKSITLNKINTSNGIKNRMKTILLLLCLTFSLSAFSQFDPPDEVWLRDRIGQIGNFPSVWDKGQGFLDYLKNQGVQDMNFQKSGCKHEQVIVNGTVMSVRWCCPSQFEDVEIDITIPYGTGGPLGTYMYFNPSTLLGISDPFEISRSEFENFMLIYFSTLYSKMQEADPNFYSIISVGDHEIHNTFDNENRELLVDGKIRVRYRKVVGWNCNDWAGM